MYPGHTTTVESEEGPINILDTERQENFSPYKPQCKMPFLELCLYYDKTGQFLQLDEELNNI